MPVDTACATPSMRSRRSSRSRATARSTDSGASPRTPTAIMGGRTAASRTTGGSAASGRLATRFTSFVSSRTLRLVSVTEASNSTQMKLTPSRDVLSTTSTSSRSAISSSMGAVTSCSTSSGDAPGSTVVMLAPPTGTSG
ncbi:MAG: hypothetical protein M5U28_52255 [Sandaracinaceae bacterium]|nr:hypothetical protein [Sandaracinaceae bacterium]